MLIGKNGSNQNKPNFKAKIKIVPDSTQLFLGNKFSKEITSWETKGGKFYDKGFSLGASVCVIGDIQSEKGFLFHSIPRKDANPIEVVSKFLKDIASKIREEKGLDLTGILVGAYSNNPVSMQQANNFMNLFEHLGIKYSAVLGYKKSEGGTSLFSSIPEKTYTVATSGLDVKTEEDLKQYYQIVKKADGDEFIFE